MDSTPSRKKRQSRMKAGPAFEFVENSSSSWNGRQNQNARAIIRRQAARSGRQGYLRESTCHDQEYSLTPPQTKDDGQEKANIPPGTQFTWPVSQPSYNGYETMRVIYNFDITALDSFIDVDLAANAYRLLRDNQSNPATFLQKGSSSFLAHLPSRYGTQPFLDDAMHCVAAKAAQMLGHSTTRFPASELHSKALRSLSTIRTDDSCPRSDVYCATRLLVLYESLGLPNTDALAMHNECGNKLLRQLGPLALSRFDRALLKSQGPHILISEMYKKQSSMFEAQAWQDFFGCAANMETSTDARYWWIFFGIMTFLPGIMKDVRVLFSETTLNPFECLSRSLAILERAQNLRRALNDSHVLYQQSASQPRSLFDLPSPAHVESTDRVRLHGFLRYPAMFLSRLQATLSLNEVDRAMGEEEAQRLAAQTLLMEKMTRHEDPTMSWHLGQRNNLPYSIIRTREEWLSIEERGRSWEELKTFLAQRWLRWEDSYNNNVIAEELERAQIED
ncbi:hypothetical protein F5Y10DRAFT_257393 [Nemania abortiva]|nr:hypothetical protein F5Y10DRAFT_257393 [Nemania abortiva]